MAGIAMDEDRKRAHFTFIWSIKNAPRDVFTKSRTFTVQSIEMTKWKLIIWISKDGKVMICIERAGEDGGPKSLEIEFEFSFLDSRGSSLVQTSCTKDFQNYTSSKWFEFPESDVVTKQRRDKFRPKVSLTVLCRIWRTRTELSNSELCFASTRFDVHKRSCLWAIGGFSYLQLGEKRMRTLNLETTDCPWLILTLYLAENNGKECIFIEIKESDVIYQHDIEAKVAVINNKGVNFLTKRFSGFKSKRSNIFKFSVCEKDILMSNETVLLSDVLFLRCEIQFSYRHPTFHEIEDYKLMDYSSSKTVRTNKGETNFDTLNATAVCPFKETVNEFKDDTTLSDVILRAETASFPVHRLILSSRSPVFKAMFAQDMKEKSSKCIDIPDMDADTLHQLLSYIYENKIQETTWKMMANLFEAADRCGMMDLSEKCSEFLKSNIPESSVCEILVLADMHRDENLRKSVVDFIQKNSEIIYSDGWRVFKENHSKLAWEIAEEIISKMNSKS